jgi:hypothetical protein
MVDPLASKLLHCLSSTPLRGHSLTRLGPPVPLYSRLGSSGRAAGATFPRSTLPGSSLTPSGPPVSRYSHLGSSGAAAASPRRTGPSRSFTPWVLWYPLISVLGPSAWRKEIYGYWHGGDPNRTASISCAALTRKP